LWETTLDRLEQGVEAVNRTFDWAIKLGVFQQHVQRRGMSWDRLKRWNTILSRLDVGPRLAEYRDLRSSLHTSPKETIALLKKRCARLAAQNNLDWDELDLVGALRHELFEIDVRFGQFGDRGIFHALDRAGLLDHQAPGVVDIDQAKTTPPGEGRAHLRGTVIKRLAPRGSTTSCEWRGLWDYDGKRYLDLSDPFVEHELWSPLEEPQASSVESHVLRLHRTFSTAATQYNRGEYEAASRTLQMIAEWSMMLHIPVRKDVNRVLAWVQARRGFLDGPSVLAEVYGREVTNLAAICDHLHVYRFHGFTVGPKMNECLERGLQMFAQNSEARPGDTASLMGHHGYQLLCEGKPDEAIAAYEDALRPEHSDFVHRRYRARLLTEQAEALRRLDRCDEANALLAEAKRVQVERHYRGDMVDLTMVQQAKTAVHNERHVDALCLLRAAAQSQADLGNLLSQTRSLLLIARTPSPPNPARTEELANVRQQILECRQQRPALAQCPLLARILEHWDLWVAGEMLAGETDFFWRL
jgi:hypothetical protein